MDRNDVFPTTLAQIGEAGLVQILQSYSPAEISGDDGAVLKPETGNLVVTMDVLVETVHFSERTTPADAVGWRAAAANLSDLAAMGARPQAIVIGLGLPAHTPLAWVKGLYDGIYRCCHLYQTDLIGGDTCRSESRFVSITALGYVQPHQVIRRRQAKPGDHLVVTGVHGSSRAGLEILLHPERGEHLDPQAQAMLIQAHQYPQPRFDVIQCLQELTVLAPETLIGGMDTSDGLADGLIQICQISGVKAWVDPKLIPIAEPLRLGFGDQALNWALYGGEDFELLLSVPGWLGQALAERITGVVKIGEVVEHAPEGQVELEGLGLLSRDQAFQHFAAD